MTLQIWTGAVIVAALCACGGGTATPHPTPAPCPEFPIPAPPDLLYPMPNATGVPDGNFTLVVGYGTFPPPPAEIAPANGGTAVAAGAWSAPPSPMPSPAATPRSSSETLYGAPVPALASHTTFEVDVTVGTPPCQQTETAGSFTTQ